jgi:holo-[acyl-carrier protein] synthase
MIYGIGVDLISVPRIEKIYQKFGSKFENKLFTKLELERSCQIKGSDYKLVFLQKSKFYAKRFVAKEAFSKALGVGIGRGINFCDIEIFNNNLGKPELRIINNRDKLLQIIGSSNFKIHLSLSDEVKGNEALAIAFVTIEIF